MAVITMSMSSMAGPVTIMTSPPPATVKTDLTSEGAEVRHHAVSDVRHLDQAGVVSLGDQRTVGDAQPRHVDINHVAANLHRGELYPEDTVAGVDHFVRDVPLLRTYNEYLRHVLHDKAPSDVGRKC